MSLTVDIKSHVTTVETLTGDDLNAQSQLLHNGYDVSSTLTSSTTPDVTKAAYQTVTMTAGAATIDLTSLLLNAVAVTMTGLKPRGIHITALTDNGASITVAKGASNGYDGMGSSFSATLEPGQGFLFDFAALGNAVGGTNKTLDMAGSGSDGVRLSVVAGPT